MTRTGGILGTCLFVAAFGAGSWAAAANPAAGESSPLRRADFRGETPSAMVQQIADWAVASGDNQGLPFIVVDKMLAKALAFDRKGTLVESTAVLIGMGTGDAFAPGVLGLEMHETQPWQRITPAGRFFAEEDRNLKGQHVLWVDYDAAIAIHKLPSKETKQRRHERIVSRDPAQHRITYGCINVPPAFYDRVVHPYFRHHGGIVYVLPDSASLKAVFKSYDVEPSALARSPRTAGLLRSDSLSLALP